MVPSSIHELRAVVTLLDYFMDRVLLITYMSISKVRRTIFCSSAILMLPKILPMYFSVPF